MNFCRPRFNLYLWPLALPLLVSGCQLLHLDGFSHKKDKDLAVVRIHIESETETAGPTRTVSILRSNPISVNISTDPILTEADVTAARVLDSPGGFAIELKFEETAAWRLEQYTASNPGKHLAIFGQWSENAPDGRWLAAPLISRTIASGTLVFTPDASHEEADQLVKGLNGVAQKSAEQKAKE
jgi:preprotein translocase subunit SecD